MDPGLASRARARFAEVFAAGEPPAVAFAPGRINLIGEHTDYNDGFVLPMAIGRGVAVGFRRRPDRRLRAHALAFGETRQVGLDGLAVGAVEGWMAYVAGVAWALETVGFRLPGLDLAIATDLPIGAGLSSSAALEVAVARAFSAAAGIPWDPVVMAQLCREAEQLFAGTPCGVMDQLASAAAQAGSALLLDCRSLAFEPVPIPAEAAFVVMDTGVRRSLAGSAYAERRAACEKAVAVLAAIDSRVRALRDVDAAGLEAAREGLEPVVFRRATHVVTETLRPAALAEALRRADLGAAGRQLDESHASLRDLFEVSSPELEAITGLARAHPACHGARLTGAGFGGCAIALVDRGEAAAFVAETEARYQDASSRAGSCFACEPEPGARLIT